jgi:two-component system LytT family response regulator
MKINCIAIDDEPLALDIIKDYALKIPFLDLKCTFYNALESLNYLKNNSVDLLFLDIQMEELTGIQLLNILKQKPLVIFTTAYDNYAIKGFELDAVDYLLKPISFERFLKAVDKAYEKLQFDKVLKSGNNSSQNQIPLDEYFFVKTEFRMEKIKFCDILYIEGMGDYLRIVTPTKKIMTLQNFKTMEDMLPSRLFCRVHKSFIVALEKIESVERCRIKIGDRTLPVSDTYKKFFYDILEKKKLV